MQIFPVIKMTVILQVRISPVHLLQSERDDKHAQKVTRMKSRMHVHKDHEQILFASVSTGVIGKDLYTLNWSCMNDDGITRGGIGGLGSPV